MPKFLRLTELRQGSKKGRGNSMVKCTTCKRKIQYLNNEGLIVTKNCSVLESDPETGITLGTCKFCKTRVELPGLRLEMQVCEEEVAF